MNTNTKTIVALAAVVAISAILVGSVIAEDAMACRHRGHGNDSSRHNTAAQVAQAGSGGDAQNLLNQNNGNDVAQINVGNQ